MENSWSSSLNRSVENDEEGKDDVYSESSGWTDILAGYSDYVGRLEAEEDQETAGAKEELFKSYGSSYHGRSDSMVSDAGSGPEWKQMTTTTDHNYNPGNNYNYKISISNNNNSLVGGGGAAGTGGDDGDGISSSPPARNIYNSNTLRKLKFKSKRMNKAEIPYDESLEDTASSPVNSPKITMGLKRMDLNAKRGAPDHSPTSSLIGKGEEEYGNYLGNDQMKTDSAVEKLFNQKMINSYNAEDCKDNHHELQNKGLCLVPISMLPNNIMNYYPMG